MWVSVLEGPHPGKVKKLEVQSRVLLPSLSQPPEALRGPLPLLPIYQGQAPQGGLSLADPEPAGVAKLKKLNSRSCACWQGPGTHSIPCNPLNDTFWKHGIESRKVLSFLNLLEGPYYDDLASTKPEQVAVLIFSAASLDSGRVVASQLYPLGITPRTKASENTCSVQGQRAHRQQRSS